MKKEFFTRDKSFYRTFFPLLAVALVYLIVVMVLGKLLAVFEKRLKRNE